MTDSRYTKRTIIKEIIPSRFLNEDRNVKIYLPPGYNELVTYPVLYCQDGEDFLHFGRTATQLTQLILDEGLEPAIAVFVDVDKSKRTSEYAPEGERHGDYIRFFAEELVPFIESRYPARTEERVVAGDSLGGTVSLHLALEYPQLFQRLIALSGAFYPSTRDRLARETDLSWLSLFMVVGLQEESVATDRGTFNFLQDNRLARGLLEERKARIAYSEKNGKHLWGFWQRELPHALRHFFGGGIA
jgi:enterochelin esterase-like enzyme